MSRKPRKDLCCKFSGLSIDKPKCREKHYRKHNEFCKTLDETDHYRVMGGRRCYSSVYNDKDARPNSTGPTNTSQDPSRESEEAFKNLDYIYVAYITMALFESPTERKLKFSKIVEYIRKKLPLCQLEGIFNVEASVEKNLQACKLFVKIPNEDDKSGVDCDWMLSPDFMRSNFKTRVIELVKLSAFMEAFNRIEDLKSSVGDENKNSVETTPKCENPSIICPELAVVNDEKVVSYFNQQLWILRMLKLGILGPPMDLISKIIDPLPTSLPSPPVPLVEEKIGLMPEDEDFLEEGEEDDSKEAIVDLQGIDDDDFQEDEDDFQDATPDNVEEDDEYPEDEYVPDDYDDPY